MSQLPDSPEQPLNYKPSELVEVLRKRLAALKQANLQLEQYVRSVEVAHQNLQEKLAQTENELRQWQANFGVRLGRTFALLGHNLHQSLRVSSGAISSTFKHTLNAQLDTPLADATLNGELEVKGWVSGPLAAPVEIEVGLNGTPLGRAEYGLTRWDVIEQRPWQTGPDCGFAGRFKLDPDIFPNGKASLKIQIKDGNSKLIEVERTVILKAGGPAEQQQLYQDWIRRTGMVGWDFLAQRAAGQKWAYQPLLSLCIAPAPTIKPVELTALLDSIQLQTYQNWEILLQLPFGGLSPELHNLVRAYSSEDERIHLQTALTPAGNPLTLFEEAQGDFIAWPEGDALLNQDAFFKVVRYLNEHQDVRVLYSDEDLIDAEGNRSQPIFKPDWSPELFRSRPYIGQLTFYRREALKQLNEGGGPDLNLGLDLQTVEATAYNLALRLFEKTGPFHHLPEVIYHSRHPLNLGQALDPKIAVVLKQHAERTGQTVTLEPGLLPGTVYYRPALKTEPVISIIIPTRDQSEVLRRCLDSIFRLSTYQNYEVIVVDNDSHQAETHQYFSELSKNLRFRRMPFEGAFNFAAINNFAAAQAKGELLVFLNNDTEVITPNWLEELAVFATQPEIGAVGARLLYPNDTLQHAGVVVGLLGIADHVLKGLPAEEAGPLGLAKTIKNVSALTAACLMTRRDLFLEVGGFDEKNLAVAFNDVDFCLKLRERGLRLVWTPYAELYHYESLSRGLDASVEKEARLHQEIFYMFSRWSGPIASDPYYNPNLSRNRLDYSVSER